MRRSSSDQLSSVPVLTASGYAFDSISSLQKDTTGNAKNATRYLSEHEAMGVKGLSFTSVYSNKFTTYSKVLSFTGASDPDYALKMNGKEVKRTARGYFSFNETLKNGEKIRVRNTVVELFATLGKYGGFVRVGSSYIINLRHVKNVSSTDVLLYDGAKIQIPRGKHTEIKNAFWDFQYEGGED